MNYAVKKKVSSLNKAFIGERFMKVFTNQSKQKYFE